MLLKDDLFQIKPTRPQSCEIIMKFCIYDADCFSFLIFFLVCRRALLSPGERA